MGSYNYTGRASNGAAPVSSIEDFCSLTIHSILMTSWSGRFHTKGQKRKSQHTAARLYMTFLTVIMKYYNSLQTDLKTFRAKEKKGDKGITP